MTKPDPTPIHGPRLATDTMAMQVPGLAALIRTITGRFRQANDDDEATIRQEDLEHDADLKGFLQNHAQQGVLIHGFTHAGAANETMLLASHLLYALNFELHRRKTFWVAPSLAYMLSRTTLDIDGELLKPPFPSCAFVFTDPDSLALGEALVLADEPTWISGPGSVKTVTAFVTVTDATSADAVGINVDLLLDQYLDEWPVLYSRNLLVRSRDRLDTILASHFPDIDPEGRDSVFTSKELKALLHLVINAVLYSTCADVDMETIRSPMKRLRKEVDRKKGTKKRRKAEQQLARFLNKATGDDVFYLPGKIPISQIEQLTQVEKSGTGPKLMTRFMVRGHWRKANPTWKEQRPRWISPYWKGPELATVIERQYEMK